jgi:tetratricopeptide (TPR) repeat protein
MVVLSLKWMKYSVVVVLLFLCVELDAQGKWRSSYVSPAHDSLLDSAKQYLSEDPALAFDFVLKAMHMAIQMKDQETQGDCYLVIGNINFTVKQYDLATENYTKALRIFQSLNNEEKVSEAEELLGKAYEVTNEFDKSEAYYKSSVEKASQTSNTKKVRASKRGLAKIYQKKGEDSKAIQELEEVKQMDISEGDIREQLLTNQQLIQAYSANQPHKALELSAENELIAQQAKDTVSLLNTLQERANILGNMDRREEKISTLQRSIDVRKQQNDIAGQSDDNLEISKVLLEQEMLDDAINYLEESIELSEKTGKTETRMEALKSLSSVYDQSGNFNMAFSVYKDYVEAAEKSALAREQKILSNLELMQSLTQRLQRIDMLENQRLLSEKTIDLLRKEQLITEKSMKQQRFIILFLTLGILLLIAATYLVYRSSRQKRVANQLLALRSLRSQMNPHFIFNALNSVNSYISKSDERSANKYLSDFSRLMRAVMENSKHDFVTLSSEIEIIELYLKLEHHRFKDKFDYSFAVDPQIDLDTMQIPPMLIQPYIENAVWHGLRYKEEKGYLKVVLSNGDHLQVIVEDNGIGRKKSLELKTKNQQVTKSTGLKNINNRLAIINQVHKTNLKVCIEDLDKEDQTGTRVTIDILQHT